MRNQIFILLLIFSLMACQKEGNEPAPFDSLEATGILGHWEIQDEVINGNISDMIPKCCEFLDFEPDDNITDNQGLLTITDSQGLINSGEFEVDLDNQNILFTDDDNDQFTFEFSVDNSQENLTIDFTENGTSFTQSWIRVE